VELTEAQRRHFVEHGYVQVPGIVPAERVAAVLRAINASLGAKGLDPKQGVTTYTPDLVGAPAVTDLVNATPLLAAAEAMIGPGRVQPVTSGQIALRFPVRGEPAEPHPHLDGMHYPGNGVPPGEIRNFTALLGVVLSDVPTPYAGNFTVWPGTHRLYEAYFREHGPQSLLDGMPPVALPEPIQITGRAGDGLICHYQLAHGIAGNASPHIRYAAYFRLSHVDHEAQKWQSMTDIWREWAGLRDVAPVLA
jgi:hypothetical protein